MNVPGWISRCIVTFLGICIAVASHSHRTWLPAFADPIRMGRRARHILFDRFEPSLKGESSSCSDVFFLSARCFKYRLHPPYEGQLTLRLIKSSNTLTKNMWENISISLKKTILPRHFSSSLKQKNFISSDTHHLPPLLPLLKRNSRELNSGIPSHPSYAHTTPIRIPWRSLKYGHFIFYGSRCMENLGATIGILARKLLGIPICPPARLGLRWPSMGTLSWTFRPLGHPTLLWSYGGAGASRQGWGKPPMLTPKKNAAMLRGGTKKGWEFVRKWRYFFEGLDSRWSIVMLFFFSSDGLVRVKRSCCKLPPSLVGFSFRLFGSFGRLPHGPSIRKLLTSSLDV